MQTAFPMELVVAFWLSLAGGILLLIWHGRREDLPHGRRDMRLVTGALLLGMAVAFAGLFLGSVVLELAERSRTSFSYSVEILPIGQGTARVLLPVPLDPGLHNAITLVNATGGIITVNGAPVLAVFVAGHADAHVELPSVGSRPPAMSRTSPAEAACESCTSTFDFTTLTGNLTEIRIEGKAHWNRYCDYWWWEAALTLVPGERQYPIQWGRPVC